MIDPRVIKQAEILVDYSTKTKKGDRVLVVADWNARPLVLAVYEKLILAGVSEVLVHIDVDEQIIGRGVYNEFSEVFFRYANNSQLKEYPKISDKLLEDIDVWIRLYAPSNTRGMSKVDAEKISIRTSVIRPLIDKRVLNTRWVLTNFPTEAKAQEADMSLSDYEDFVFSAINYVNWKKKKREQEKLKSLLSRTEEVHIVGPETDLRLGKKGRAAINASGQHNMPDGEVFTSVIENNAGGFITYSYPVLYMGREFHSVRLEFKEGKVVKATAEKNENDLNKILNMDLGARYLGELGIGNNYAIERFSKDILFDEKIGGSVHLALGNGYKDTGSKNESGLHWDMIKDLRQGPASGNSSAMQGGELWFDDKLVQKNGKWLIKL